MYVQYSQSMVFCKKYVPPQLHMIKRECFRSNRVPYTCNARMCTRAGHNAANANIYTTHKFVTCVYLYVCVCVCGRSFISFLSRIIRYIIYYIRIVIYSHIPTTIYVRYVYICSVRVYLVNDCVMCLTDTLLIFL